MFQINYLKSQYPFKIIKNFFRITNKTCEAVQTSFDLKKNRSDSAIVNMVEDISIQENESTNNCSSRKSLTNLFESQNITQKESTCGLKSVCSNNSLGVSKTSSEHSIEGMLNKGKSLTDLKSRSSLNNNIALSDQTFEYRLGKLHKSLKNSVKSSRELLKEEKKSKLKRAYPWQNFNLNSIQSRCSDEDITKYNSKAYSRSNSHMCSEHGNLGPKIKSSKNALRSYNSTSLLPAEKKQSKESLRENECQMPLFKSILKKTASKAKPMKDVAFNNISTIYGQKNSNPQLVESSKTNLSKSSSRESTTKKVPVKIMATPIEGNRSSIEKTKALNSGTKAEHLMAKFQPPKEEHSFLFLYHGKRQKTIH